jgi:hypothetical protein
VTGVTSDSLSVVRSPGVGPDFLVTFNFVGFSGDTALFDAAIPGTLTDGNYFATLLPDHITDTAGHPLANGRTLDFFSLAGDANHDRTVGPGDFNLLATNFGKTGQPWANGDFDHDGVVGPSDFNILATRFGTTLAPPRGAARGGRCRRNCGIIGDIANAHDDGRARDHDEKAHQSHARDRPGSPSFHGIQGNSADAGERLTEVLGL